MYTTLHKKMTFLPHQHSGNRCLLSAVDCAQQGYHCAAMEYIKGMRVIPGKPVGFMQIFYAYYL